MEHNILFPQKKEKPKSETTIWWESYFWVRVERFQTQCRFVCMYIFIVALFTTFKLMDKWTVILVHYVIQLSVNNGDFLSFLMAPKNVMSSKICQTPKKTNTACFLSYVKSEAIEIVEAVKRMMVTNDWTVIGRGNDILRE